MSDLRGFQNLGGLCISIFDNLRFGSTKLSMKNEKNGVAMAPIPGRYDVSVYQFRPSLGARERDV
ncbi:MAG: hypothetical protein DRI57_12645 [Deltaproteobacteria bacterium]|nr:MAG: hypothetical protein DRI57_12645 [Deltaproteobacteria bacterium]